METLKKNIRELVIAELKKSDIVKMDVDNKEGEKYYKDVEKRFEKPKTNNSDIDLKPDFNQTTIDITFDQEPSKEYKDKVKAQVSGYTSKAEMDNKSVKNGDFDTNSDIYGAIEDKHKIRSTYKKNVKKSGLTANKMPHDMFDENDIFENAKTIKFNKTVFLNESHMQTQIPSSQKINENLFIMKDSKDNEYFIKWSDNGVISEGVVMKYQNVTKSNNELNRIKDMFNYKYTHGRSTYKIK